MRMNHIPLVASLAALVPVVLTGAETPFTSTRSVAMGGTGLATALDTEAGIRNAAALAWSSDEVDAETESGAGSVIGVQWADVNAGVVLTGEVSTLLERLEGVELEELESTGDDDLTDQEVRDLVIIADAFSRIDEPGNAIFADVHAASAIRYGSFAIGAQLRGEVGAFVTETDFFNVGLTEFSANEIEVALIDNAVDDGIDGTESRNHLNSDQVARLNAAGINDDRAIVYLDREVGDAQSDGTVKSSSVDDIVTLFENMARNSTDGMTGATTLDNNQTVVVMRGLALQEIPVSYGYDFNENLAVGITVKGIIGTNYANSVVVFDEDNDEVFETIDEESEETLNVGVDLSVLYRMPSWRFTIVGRDLNEPEFDGFTSESTGVEWSDLKVDSQVRVGAAWKPLSWIVLEANADVLQAETLVGSYDTQYVGAGASFEVLRVLTLRGGVYQNIAPDDTDPAFTAGFGLDLWALEIDFAAAVGTGTAEYDGDDVPNEARVGLSLRTWF